MWVYIFIIYFIILFFMYPTIILISLLLLGVIFSIYMTVLQRKKQELIDDIKKKPFENINQKQ